MKTNTVTIGKKPDLKKAAAKLASAYRTWIMANAEYNSLLNQDNSYTIRWTRGPEDRRKKP